MYKSICVCILIEYENFDLMKIVYKLQIYIYFIDINFLYYYRLDNGQENFMKLQIDGYEYIINVYIQVDS